MRRGCPPMLLAQASLLHCWLEAHHSRASVPPLRETPVTGFPLIRGRDSCIPMGSRLGWSATLQNRFRKNGRYAETKRTQKQSYEKSEPPEDSGKDKRCVQTPEGLLLRGNRCRNSEFLSKGRTSQSRSYKEHFRLRIRTLGNQSLHAIPETLVNF